MRMQQKNAFVSSCEERMVCPKPRRLGVFNATVNEPVRPLRWHMRYEPEPYKSSLELLEIIFENTPVTSSSPFLTGSPPTRVSNPLTQDTRFRHNKLSLTSGHPPVSGMPSMPPLCEKKVDPVNGNFGNKPAVRIEGFDCISTLV